MTDAEKISYLIDIANESLPIYLGTAIVSFGLLNGFLSYYLPYLFLRNKEVKLTPSPAFKDLRVPRPEWIILVIAFLVVTFAAASSNYNIVVLSSVMRSAIMLVFTVQGLSFLTYLYKEKRFGIVFFVFAIIIGSLLNVLFWLGLFEATMRLRTRIDMMKNDGGGWPNE